MTTLLLIGLLLACDPKDTDSGSSADGGAADGGDSDGGGDGGSTDGGSTGDGGDSDGGAAGDDHIWVSSSDAWTALSTGSQHACAIDSAGALTCWGYDWDGRTDVPELAQPIQSVGCGGDFSCALDADGLAHCWGGEGTVLDSVPTDSFATLVAGYDFACALDAEGNATCWGDDEHQQLQVRGGPFVALSAGRTHACGLAADGQVACWGGQDPPSTPGLPDPPHDGEVVDYDQTVVPEGSWKGVAAGDYHTCLIDMDDGVLCFGNDRAGETSPPEGVSFATVSAGGAHSCGLDLDGGMHCWGADTASWDYFQALEPDGSFTAVDTASVYSCGLRSTDGGQEVACWGALGDLPVQVP